MANFTSELLILFFISVFCQEVDSLHKDQFYPFGTKAGDKSLPKIQDDVSSSELRLKTPIKFFSREYTGIYVNENGLVSFLTEIPSFFNVEFPLDYPLIAALYSDVDCRGSGNVWYRIINSANGSYLIDRSTNEVNKLFPKLSSRFRTQELVVVTWENVGYYNNKADKVNSFQIVIASDDSNSFAFLNYADRGIEWIKAMGKNRNMPDARAQAGIISGEGTFFTLPGSGRDQVQRLDRMSNVNEAGVWAFHLGPWPALQNVKQPEINLTPEFSPALATSCQTGSSMCHTSANCQQYSEGFCCICQNGWFGNGETCLSNGFPQRIRGKVNGVINSIAIEDQDLHCYVVTDDGRTYTAISKVGKLGYNMQVLTPISSPISWLFAQPSKGAENGFSISGGNFNYTADVTFPDTGHSAQVKYIFKGLDAFDYLHAEVILSGTIPPLDKSGGKIRVDDYVEEFTRIRPGLIQSQSSRQIGYEGKSKTIRFDVRQTIQFSPCKYEKTDPRKRVVKLRSTRNFIVYDDPEQVVRFAMTSYVVPTDSRDDPCLEKTCDAHSVCLVQNDVAICVCQLGFQDDAGHCVDLDECGTRRHTCSPNADCFNTPGSFECSCKNGFTGNGVDCIEDRNCDDLKCHAAADCVEDSRGQPKCQCWAGYEGDGQRNCQIIPSDVRISQNSSPESLTIDAPSGSQGPARSLEGLGPVFFHHYEISNLGPHTVGNLLAQVTWPLREGYEYVTYLPETPFVKYVTSTGEEFIDPCQMESDEDVNPLQLISRGRKRRQSNRPLAGEEYPGDYIENDDDEDDDEDDDYEGGSKGARVLENEENPPEVTYYDYDANFGVVLNETESPSLDFEDPAYRVPPSYDYSHFDVYNTGKTKSPITTTTPASTTASNSKPERRRPGAGGRSKATTTTTETPRAERVQLETRNGNSRFICKINLSPQERAVITIKAHLVTHTVNKLYKDATQFKITSNAEIIPSDSYNLSPSPRANVVTLARINVQQAPGKGIECGNAVCSRYADCHVNLDSEVEQRLSQCLCLTGFKGNGINCQRLKPHEESLDCRQSRNCDDQAQCLYDKSREIFACVCNQGFSGNGLTCRQDTENCAFADNCSPYATCDQESDNIFRCKCRQGYSGDGYECQLSTPDTDSTDEEELRPMTEDPQPKCIFSVCFCPIGYIFDGNRNCDRDQLSAAVSDGAVARPSCYLRQCVCPNGYLLDRVENICIIQEISFPASVVYCDASGIQCGVNGRCVFDRSRDHSICVCNRGFVGDGFECEKVDQTLLQTGNCLTHTDCSTDEKCVLKPLTNRSGKFSYSCIPEQRPTLPDSADRDGDRGALQKIPELPEPEGEDRTTESSRPKNLCERHSDCDENAKCEFDSSMNLYHCKCEEFYEGNGFQCHPTPDAGCNIKKDCNANAGCYLDEISMTHYCRCKDGFSGDGYDCKPDVIGCNVIDNCGKHATCRFDQNEGGYRCKCNIERGFEGDGYTCKLTIPCWQNPGVCDPNAECVQLPAKQRQPEYGCKCKDGFLGDGFSCEALPVFDGNYLIASQGMALMKVGMDASRVKPGLPIYVKPFMTAAAFGIDCFKGKLFMADTTGRSIRRVSYDGKDMEIFLEENVDFPEGVSVDWQARNIFWTDSGKRTIEVANLDTKTRKILFDEQIRNPRGIAIHPGISRIFWSDWDPTHPRIESSNFDGSDRRIIVDALLGMPNSLDIDMERQELCWTDAGSQSKQTKSKIEVMPKIECIGINLSNRHPIVELSSNEMPYGLALTETRIFWTDWKIPGVHAADRISGKRLATLPHVLQTMGRPFGIISIPSECRRERSECQSAPGFCNDQQLCLSNGRSGLACLCGDNGKIPTPQQLMHQLQQQQQQQHQQLPPNEPVCEDVIA